MHHISRFRRLFLHIISQLFLNLAIITTDTALPTYTTLQTNAITMDSSNSAHPAGGLPRFINGGEIELVSIVGTGAYGVVYLAIDATHGQPVYRAVKCLRRHGLDTRQRHFQRREIALHRLASAHSSIITMDGLIQEGDHLYVVMDYGEDGDLFAMITERQRVSGSSTKTRMLADSCVVCWKRRVNP